MSTRFTGSFTSPAARRRVRRTGRARLICSTNGCATALVVDASARTAACPICGYFRRVAAGSPGLAAD